MKTVNFIIIFLLLVSLQPALFAASDSKKQDTLELKAWGVPSSTVFGPVGESSIRIVKEFQRLHPDIKLASATGLIMPNRSMDTVPLMQIAGDISPAVIYVNFRQSSTYINQKFLSALDKYIEKTSGTDVRDGHLMNTKQYLTALRKGKLYSEVGFEDRIPAQCWEVIRRECPYGVSCPYVKEWKSTPAAEHFHVWAMPQTQVVTSLFYRKDLFAEAGL
ncbi:MAG: hypothetical protein WCP55_13930, partial [Lentisphaerota bacterium]